MSPRTYLQRKRTGMAKRLLEGTDMTVTEVASQRRFRERDDAAAAHAAVDDANALSDSRSGTRRHSSVTPGREGTHSEVFRGIQQPNQDIQIAAIHIAATVPRFRKSSVMTLLRVAFAFLCLTVGDKPAAALDARVIFEERAGARPRDDAPAIRLTMQGVLHARDQASRPDLPVAELPDRQSVVLVRDGRYRLESDTEFPGAIRFHYLTIGSPTAWGSVDLIRWRDGNEIDRTEHLPAPRSSATCFFWRLVCCWPTPVREHRNWRSMTRAATCA